MVRRKTTFVKRDVEGNEIIESPHPGDIVNHTGWHPGPKLLPGYPSDVLIINGAYMSEGKLSNYWNWRKITIDKKGGMTLGPIVSGYGSFIPTEVEYDTEMLLKLSKRN
jgi:hypothetical protein